MFARPNGNMGISPWASKQACRARSNVSNGKFDRDLLLKARNPSLSTRKAIKLFDMLIYTTPPGQRPMLIETPQHIHVYHLLYTFLDFFFRYSLSEEKLIRQQIEYHSMTVFVSMSPQTIYMSGLDPQGDSMDIAVRCLDCDSVSQVKEKALDTIYR